MNYSKVESRPHTHTQAHLKITFLNVLDCSEYSDTNILKKKFYENI